MNFKFKNILKLNNNSFNLLDVQVKLFISLKKQKSKFIINFFNFLIKSIFISINSTPIIIFDCMININKEYKIAFIKIFGISIIRCEQLRKLVGITNHKYYKLKYFNKIIISNIKNYLLATSYAGFKLIKLISFEKEKFLEVRCFKRNRFLLGYPANGQRTRTNASTAKKFKIKI